MVWYEDLSVEVNGEVEGLSITEDGTVLAVVDYGLREVDLQGRVQLHVPRSTLDVGLHHDAFRRNGLTWALFSDVVTVDEEDYKLDGFLVFDRAGAIVDRWFLGDHHTPGPVGGLLGLPVDYSHANSIWVDAREDVLVSFRNVSSLVKVAGRDRASAGTIEWVLAGEAEAPLGQDFTVANATGGLDGFAQQHDWHQLADGRLALFDNRRTQSELSRLLLLEADSPGEEGGTGAATLVEAYDLGRHCPFQGYAARTGAGGLMATCAPSRTAVEFAPGTQGSDGEPDAQAWRFTVACDPIGSSMVPQFVPLELQTLAEAP